MSDIKLFVCCHQSVEVPKQSLLIPVQVGAALAGCRFPGFLYDDSGDNISEKNRSYCELTAQYWAWKNVKADYYGFFHYRRYLYPDEGAKLPYRIEKKASLPLLDKLGYGGFAELIPQYDLIVPKGEDMRIPVREHYAKAPFHHYRDLEAVEEIVCQKHPQMAAAMETYLSGTVNYFGNIHIMSHDVFRDYCAWLFPLLEEFDRRTDFSGYSVQEQRVDGYLAERLLGIYLTFWRGELRTLELPRVHFVPNERERKKKQVLNALFPPGSRRRGLVKTVTEDRRQGGHFYGRTDFL